MANSNTENGTLRHWIEVRLDKSGKFVAHALGLPEVAATADTRMEAIDQVHQILAGLIESGQLVAIDLRRENPLLQWSGRVDPDDPHEQAYLKALARQRQIDLENTIRELDQECSNSSSIPTT